MHKLLLGFGLVLVVGCVPLAAQAPPASQAATPAAQQVHADMNQLMRGLLFPAANVVFAAQAEDPEEIAKTVVGDPGMATDPIKAAFGGWQAVQNAALTLAESANLLTTDGRVCSTGVPVPARDPSWEKFVAELRDASMKAYAAAMTRSQEQMFAASETLAANCTGCHRMWRDRRPPAIRCAPR